MNSTKLLKDFIPAVSEHRAVDEQVLSLLRENLQEKYIDAPTARFRTLKYIQRNFFSILFLSIYRAIGIPKPRRIFYGVINHSIRGIVTGTDNLLDDEYKGMLPLRFPESATRFKSVMHILLFDRFLFSAIHQAIAGGLLAGQDAQALQREIFKAMVPIGAEEAAEEGGVFEILTPHEILSSIHMYKGGNLLCLVFVAPCLIERAFASPLELARQGVYRIGMSLQVIDDLTDFYEDLAGRNHNFLVSSIFHEGTREERCLLAAAIGRRETGDGPDIVTAYPRTVARVMEQAIGEALAGFGDLETAGFRLSQKNALRLIRFLFHIRGVDRLLSLLPEDRDISLTLDVRPAAAVG